MCIRDRYYTDYFFFIKIDDLFYMVTTLSHMASYLAACRATPVIISVFGRLYMKKNDHPPGREDTRSGTKKRCSRHLFCVILVAVLLAVLKL